MFSIRFPSTSLEEVQNKECMLSPQTRTIITNIHSTCNRKAEQQELKIIFFFNYVILLVSNNPQTSHQQYVLQMNKLTNWFNSTVFNEMHIKCSLSKMRLTYSISFSVLGINRLMFFCFDGR